MLVFIKTNENTTMSDSLQGFKVMVDPTILGRGRDHFRQGCVLEIKEIEQGEYRAAVEGSEVYEVLVSLDDECNILDISCDCPYDWDAHCKHQAAVLFALRQQLTQNGSEPARKQPPHQSQSPILAMMRTASFM